MLRNLTQRPKVAAQKYRPVTHCCQVLFDFQFGKTILCLFRTFSFVMPQNFALASKAAVYLI